MTETHYDIDLEETPGTALAVRQPIPLALTPDVTAQDLVSRLDLIRDSMNRAMIEDVDYGRIPGTDKPTLLKPGAEKLGVMFKLDVQLVNEKERDGAHLTVTSHATVFHAETGARLGYGEGMCSTYEKKYRYRTADRACPECNQPTIKRSKFDDQGWYCFAKIGGCGAKFRADDPQIVNQKTGQVENPDLADTWNTVLKMAEKRARVDAILAVTGASALFTQDAEDAPQAAAPSDMPSALQSDEDDHERASLVGEILGLADKLGKLDAKSEEISRHRGEHTPQAHMRWLKSQLAKAQRAVEARERQQADATAAAVAELADEGIEFAPDLPSVDPNQQTLGDES